MTSIGPHDLIDIPGLGQFEVVGYPEDYSNGPWPFVITIPAPHAVGVHSYVPGGAKDAYGREVPAWTPALNTDGVSVAAHGWANPKNDEPKMVGHDRVVIDLELYLPGCVVVNLRRAEG